MWIVLLQFIGILVFALTRRQFVSIVQNRAFGIALNMQSSWTQKLEVSWHVTQSGQNLILHELLVRCRLLPLHNIVLGWQHMCDFCYIYCFGFQTNCLYSAQLGCYFPTLCFWLCLLMFVRSTWGNVVSQVGKGSSVTDLAMRNSTAGIAAHHAGASTMQRATPRMVCFYFINVFFLFCSGGGILVLSVIHHHSQLWYCLSFIINSLFLPSLTSWPHVLSMAEVLYVQNLHFSFLVILLPKVWDG